MTLALPLQNNDKFVTETVQSRNKKRKIFFRLMYMPVTIWFKM